MNPDPSIDDQITKLNEIIKRFENNRYLSRSEREREIRLYRAEIAKINAGRETVKINQ